MSAPGLSAFSELHRCEAARNSLGCLLFVWKAMKKPPTPPTVAGLRRRQRSGARADLCRYPLANIELSVISGDSMRDVPLFLEVLHSVL